MCRSRNAFLHTLHHLWVWVQSALPHGAAGLIRVIDFKCCMTAPLMLANMCDAGTPKLARHEPWLINLIDNLLCASEACRTVSLQRKNWCVCLMDAIHQCIHASTHGANSSSHMQEAEIQSLPLFSSLPFFRTVPVLLNSCCKLTDQSSLASRSNVCLFGPQMSPHLLRQRNELWFFSGGPKSSGVKVSSQPGLKATSPLCCQKIPM